MQGSARGCMGRWNNRMMSLSPPLSLTLLPLSLQTSTNNFKENSLVVPSINQIGTNLFLIGQMISRMYVNMTLCSYTIWGLKLQKSYFYMCMYAYIYIYTYKRWSQICVCVWPHLLFTTLCDPLLWSVAWPWVWLASDTQKMGRPRLTALHRDCFHQHWVKTLPQQEDDNSSKTPMMVSIF